MSQPQGVLARQADGSARQKVGDGPGSTCNCDRSAGKGAMFNLTPVRLGLRVVRIGSGSVIVELCPDLSGPQMVTAARLPNGEAIPINGQSSVVLRLPAGSRLGLLSENEGVAAPCFCVGVGQLHDGEVRLQFCNLSHRLAS